ncbi:MAG: protein kinase, partial [Armatimonadetes bacterium]|nr:protein kinase [Armatimonadota bacterium]
MGAVYRPGKAPREEEARIIKSLLEALPARHIVLGTTRFDRYRKDGLHQVEADAVVVADHGIFVVELKGWKGGRLESRGRRWFRDGYPYRSNHLKALDRLRERLQTDLRLSAGDFSAPNVFGIFFFHGGIDVSSVIDEARQHARQCFVSGDLGEVVARLLRPMRGQPAISGDARRYWADVLENIGDRDVADRPLVGRVIGGFCRVERRIDEPVAAAAPLAAEVYRGRHTVHGTPLKMTLYRVPQYELDRETLYEAVSREWRALGLLDGIPGVPATYDPVETEEGLWHVSQWVDGRSLREVLRSGGPLSEEEVLGFLLQAAAILEAVHARRTPWGNPVLHRDIRPEAFRVDDQGTLWLVNFHAAAGPVTSLGPARIDPAALAYPSPEILAGLTGEQLDPRSDIYQLGAVAIELATGRRYEPPLRAAEVGEVLRRIALRCVASQREARFADARHLREALLAAFSGRPGVPAPEAADASRLPELIPGARVGDYRLLRRLGRGGLAEVWLAYDTRPDQETKVALKIAGPMPLAGQALAEEARVLHRLRHLAIRGLHGPLDHLEPGRPVLPLEFVDGQTFDVWSRHQPRGNLQALMPVVRDVCRALAHAWDEARVPHLDLHPGNIIIARGGQAKVLDLGLGALLVRARDEADAVRIGVAPYAAPEILEGAAG